MFGDIDHDRFAIDLALQVDTLLDSKIDDVNELVHGYNNACMSVLDAHAPLTVKTHIIRHKPAWFTITVRDARRARRKCERRWRKSRSEADRQAYIESQRTVVDIICKEKKSYYNEKLLNCSIKDMHKTINTLLNQNQRVLPDSTSPSVLANDFSNYFVGKVHTIRSNIDKVTDCDQVYVSSDRNVQSCTFPTFKLVSNDELCKIVSKCADKSCHLDPMPTWLVKKHLPILLPLLCRVVNTSLSSGCFPAELRRAIITPVIKKTSLDKQELKNYRPVSNLPFLGKLIEKVVSVQVADYVYSNELAEPLQSAYRPDHSTETALLLVHDTIQRAIDTDMAVFVVLLDLTAAFDTVDHSILMQRLSLDFGVSGIPYNWFKSYLHMRSCQVLVKGVHSDPVDLVYGVPQGSVLGPQAFVYYTHTIGQIIRKHGIQYHVYADDVQLLITFDPRRPGDAVCSLYKLSQCIMDLQSWLTANKLMLNNSKTEFFIASSSYHYKSLQHLTLHVGGLEIPHSPSIKNLGVSFDHNMKMSDHVTQISRSLNWQIGNLHRIRRFLDFDACSSAVRTLILSRLDYCCTIFNGINKKDLHRLQKLQNRAARLIFMKPKCTHTSPLIRDLHWLPVAERIQFRTLVQTYKLLKSSSPEYLSSLLQVQQSPYSLRSTAAGNSLIVHRSHKQAGDRAFSIIAPRLWNGLPVSVRQAVSISSFRKLLKHHLFSKL